MRLDPVGIQAQLRHLGYFYAPCC